MSLKHLFCSAALGITFFLSTSGISQAHPDDWRHHRDDPRERRAYFAHPHTRYVVAYGTGYRGRGYYFGPPGVHYYYEGPHVAYYHTRDAVPRAYWANVEVASRESTSTSVQRALSRRGYYGGAIDGIIGRHSRHAISHYQSEHGLRVTGSITPGLLRSLRVA